MTATTLPSREDLVAVFLANGVSEADANLVADAIPAEQRAAAITSYEENRREREGVRARLAADRELLRAVCPAATWKAEDDRYEVARRALKLVDAVAEKHSTTAHELAVALIEGGGTIQDTIDMHGDDPRTVLWGNQAFYAFRFRLADAVQVACSERLERERREREAQREALWAARGLERCDRCGGAGGANHWPGWTCFDCDGHGATPRARSNTAEVSA